MIPGARSPHANRPSRPRWLTVVLAALGIFILVVFIVDKTVLGPAGPSSIPVAGAIDHLNRHDVRRVVVPAGPITLELNDGKTISTEVTPDRDLWPAVKRSGADVSIVARTGAATTSPLWYALQFVPFIIMALLLLFVLRTARGVGQ